MSSCGYFSQVPSASYPEDYNNMIENSECDMTQDAAAKTAADCSNLTVEELCMQVGLYDPKKLDSCERTVATLRFDRFHFDAPCIWCGRDSTFHSTHQPYRPNDIIADARKRGVFTRSVQCARDEHAYSYYFLVTSSSIQKIGQFPSIQDITVSNIKRYSGVLGGADFSELNRATGLFSHGIGIGSFVYLRRIFERMIYAHYKTLEDEGRPVEGFISLRMGDKIGALAAVLPSGLVKNKAVYGILSKGIHELDEETCLAAFPVVRAAIIQILEQDLEARNKAKAEQELEREVAKLHHRLKPKV
jgi:hypothetical protein